MAMQDSWHGVPGLMARGGGGGGGAGHVPLKVDKESKEGQRRALKNLRFL